MFLHVPDRTTPFRETCEAMNTAHNAGAFNEFGLSNFNPAEVEEIVEICKANGWVVPTVYEGQYNAIVRGCETDLLPILRKHGMRFHAFRFV